MRDQDYANQIKLDEDKKKSDLRIFGLRLRKEAVYGLIIGCLLLCASCIGVYGALNLFGNQALDASNGQSYAQKRKLSSGHGGSSALASGETSAAGSGGSSAAGSGGSSAKPMGMAEYRRMNSEREKHYTQRSGQECGRPISGGGSSGDMGMYGIGSKSFTQKKVADGEKSKQDGGNCSRATQEKRKHKKVSLQSKL